MIYFLYFPRWSLQTEERGFWWIYPKRHTLIWLICKEAQTWETYSVVVVSSVVFSLPVMSPTLVLDQSKYPTIHIMLSRTWYVFTASMHYTNIESHTLSDLLDFDLILKAIFIVDKSTYCRHFYLHYHVSMREMLCKTQCVTSRNKVHTL